MKKLLALGIVLICGACATNANTDIAALGGSLSAAIVVADGYFKLPVCGTEIKGQLCKKPALVKTLKLSMDTATQAFVLAATAGTSAAVLDAQAKVSALSVQAASVSK